MKNKYRLIADYHTHTIYSKFNHGKGTIEENVQRAVELGLEEICITDHGPGHFSYGVDRKKFPEIRGEIDRLNEIYKGKIKIYFGVEANVVGYDGSIDVTDDLMEYLDIINVGFHNGVIFKDFKSFFNYHVLNRLSKWFGYKTQEIIEKNTDAIIKIVEKHKIKVVTHPGDKIKVDVYRLGKVCKDRGTLMEINAHHTHMNVEEIRLADKTGCKMSVGSDAHRPEDVGNVDIALERLEKSGIDLSKVVNIEVL